MTAIMIVESPNKIKKIAHYLEEIGMTDIKVMASVGHIRDLPKKEMGVDTTTFVPTYLVSEEKIEVVKKLKSALKNATEVYLATDPDREGESIAWHLYDALGIRKLNVPLYRVKFNELNKKAIAQAIKDAGKIDMQLVYAQEARRVLDRFVGYMVSPRLGSKLSAGRVQSPALRLIVEREEAIKSFVSINYFDVRATISGVIRWHAGWVHADYRDKGQTHWLNEEVATEIAKVTKLTVQSVDKRKRSAKAPAPFTTSSLLQAASSVLKFSPEETMRLAQSLFSQGAISYHRTDSPNLSEDSFLDVIAALKALNLPHVIKPNKWAAKSGAQEAHEAIRPVDCKKAVAGDTEQEQALYRLIHQRTLACQMPDAVFDVTTILFDSDVRVQLNGHPGSGKIAVFKAQGEVLTDQPGWRALAAKTAETDVDDDSDEDGANQALPRVEEGDVIPVTGELLKKQTLPAGRYKEASLVKELESMEIGRPSTYAALIANIKGRDYVLINKKREMEPTEKGNGVIAMLKSAHFSFLEYDWTKEIELRLDAISLGKDKYKTLVSDIYSVLEKEIQGLPEIARGGDRAVVSDMHCSCDAGGPIEESGKAFQCQSCKATVWKVVANRDITKKEAAALLSGNELEDLSGFISKAKKTFNAGLRMKEGKVEFFFSEDGGEKDAASQILFDGVCMCGGQINKTAKYWKCGSCEATVWNNIAGRTVIDEEARRLFSNERVEMEGFVSKKSGSSFSAFVVLKNGKTEFEFS